MGGISKWKHIDALKYGLAIFAILITGLLLLSTGVFKYPILFTAGMSMMDTMDGFFMTKAYQWVFSSPLRKVYYNLTLTGLSILAAGVIGIIEVGQVFAQERGLNSGFWIRLQNLDFNAMGFMLVGMFVVVWIVSFLGWKLLRLGEKESSFV